MPAVLVRPDWKSNFDFNERHTIIIIGLVVAYLVFYITSIGMYIYRSEKFAISSRMFKANLTSAFGGYILILLQFYGILSDSQR